MKEIRGQVRCDIGFGKTPTEILKVCQERGSIPNIAFSGVNNPMPTGDHWKAIEWVVDFRKKGQSVLMHMSPHRRDFIKRASAALTESGGFYMEIVSKVARKFRDDNDLRMQRGKVYVFVSLIAPIEEDILPLSEGDYKDSEVVVTTEEVI